MSFNLLKIPVIETSRLPKVGSVQLVLPYNSIDLGWDEKRECFGGKVLVNREKLPTRRFINIAMQFYAIINQKPIMTLVSKGLGTIVTRPNDLLDQRYSVQRFHASMHYDASACMELDDVRKNLNIPHLIDIEDLDYEQIILTDSKKARIYFETLPEDDELYSTVKQYSVLGLVVKITKQSKNQSPDSYCIGVLTATGILYRLEQNSAGEVTGYTVYACLSM